MSDQLVNTTAPDAKGTAYDEARKLQGGLVVGIRVDEVPTGEADRLAAEGKFYPLTMDAAGFLRVSLPETGTQVETQELEVLREILAVQQAMLAALLKIQ